MNYKRIASEVLLWLIALFLAWVFFRQGLSKFDDGSGWSRAFRAWHFPTWFRILIGVLEVAAAILVLIPRLATIGGVIIIVIMLGGMGTHIRWNQARYVTSEIMPLVLGSITAIARRKKLQATFEALRDRQ